MNDYGKIQPQAIELEEVILGAIMLEKNAFDLISNILTPDSFYKEAHSLLFRAISEITIRKEPVDIMTVTQECKKRGWLELIGGPYYITQLTNRVSSSDNIEYHARIVAQKWMQRELIRLSYEINKNCYNDTNDVFDEIERIQKAVKKLEESVISDKIYSPNETIDQVVINIKQTEKRKGVVGWPTGIVAIDKATLGLQRKLKYTIGALPSVGKTAFAKSILINVSDSCNVPGLFFSMEMTREQLMIQCISQLLQINNQLIRTGQITEFDYIRIEQIKKSFFGKNFIIHDETKLTHQKMRTLIKRAVDEYGIGWFAVDHVGKMGYKGSTKGMTKEQIVNENTSELKNFAKEFDLACVELTQLTKETSKRSDFRPVIGDIRDSGGIESEADVVMLLYRPEHHGLKTYRSIDTKGYAEIILAKNRDGPIGNYVTKYVKEFTQFVNNELGTEIESDDIPF